MTAVLSSIQNDIEKYIKSPQYITYLLDLYGVIAPSKLSSSSSDLGSTLRLFSSTSSAPVSSVSSSSTDSWSSGIDWYASTASTASSASTASKLSSVSSIEFTDYLQRNNLNLQSYLTGVQNGTIDYKLFTIDEIISDFNKSDLSDLDEGDILKLKLLLASLIQFYENNGQNLTVVPFWQMASVQSSIAPSVTSTNSWSSGIDWYASTSRAPSSAPTVPSSTSSAPTAPSSTSSAPTLNMSMFDTSSTVTSKAPSSAPTLNMSMFDTSSTVTSKAPSSAPTSKAPSSAPTAPSSTSSAPTAPSSTSSAPTLNMGMVDSSRAPSFAPTLNMGMFDSSRAPSSAPTLNMSMFDTSRAPSSAPTLNMNMFDTSKAPSSAPIAPSSTSSAPTLNMSMFNRASSSVTSSGVSTEKNSIQQEINNQAQPSPSPFSIAQNEAALQAQYAQNLESFLGSKVDSKLRSTPVAPSVKASSASSAPIAPSIKRNDSNVSVSSIPSSYSGSSTPSTAPAVPSAPLPLSTASASRTASSAPVASKSSSNFNEIDDLFEKFGFDESPIESEQTLEESKEKNDIYNTEISSKARISSSNAPTYKPTPFSIAQNEAEFQQAIGTPLPLSSAPTSKSLTSMEPQSSAPKASSLISSNYGSTWSSSSIGTVNFTDYLETNGLTLAEYVNGVRNSTIDYKLFTIDEIINDFNNSNLSDLAEVDIVQLKLYLTYLIQFYENRGDRLNVIPFWQMGTIPSTGSSVSSASSVSTIIPSSGKKIRSSVLQDAKTKLNKVTPVEVVSQSILGNAIDKLNKVETQTNRKQFDAPIGQVVSPSILESRINKLNKVDEPKINTFVKEEKIDTPEVKALKDLKTQIPFVQQPSSSGSSWSTSSVPVAPTAPSSKATTEWGSFQQGSIRQPSPFSIVENEAALQAQDAQNLESFLGSKVDSKLPSAPVAPTSSAPVAPASSAPVAPSIKRNDSNVSVSSIPSSYSGSSTPSTASTVPSASLPLSSASTSKAPSSAPTLNMSMFDTSSTVTSKAPSSAPTLNMSMFDTSSTVTSKAPSSAPTSKAPSSAPTLNMSMFDTSSTVTSKAPSSAPTSKAPSSAPTLNMSMFDKSSVATSKGSSVGSSTSSTPPPIPSAPLPSSTSRAPSSKAPSSSPTLNMGMFDKSSAPVASSSKSSTEWGSYQQAPIQLNSDLINLMSRQSSNQSNQSIDSNIQLDRNDSLTSVAPKDFALQTK